MVAQTFLLFAEFLLAMKQKAKLALEFEPEKQTKVDMGVVTKQSINLRSQKNVCFFYGGNHF